MSIDIQSTKSTFIKNNNLNFELYKYEHQEELF